MKQSMAQMLGKRNGRAELCGESWCIMYFHDFQLSHAILWAATRWAQATHFVFYIFRVTITAAVDYRIICRTTGTVLPGTQAHRGSNHDNRFGRMTWLLFHKLIVMRNVVTKRKHERLIPSTKNSWDNVVAVIAIVPLRFVLFYLLPHPVLSITARRYVVLVVSYRDYKSADCTTQLAITRRDPIVHFTNDMGHELGTVSVFHPISCPFH